MLYDFFLFWASLILDIFFKEIKVRGILNVPKKGPVIFVVGKSTRCTISLTAPHANQFIDPLVVMKHCGRAVSYLCAKKSFERFWVGLFARAFGAIPVTRPQDLSVKVKGKVYIIKGDSTTLHLLERPSSNILSPRASLQLKWDEGYQCSAEVVSVEKPDLATINLAEECILELDQRGLLSREQLASCTVDQKAMFNAVYETLVRGKCVGIFPEGGSHDRSEFLPLKPGFAIMALGAMEKYPGLNVQIVPCGLHYFNRDKFRSRAVIEFGEPIIASQEMIEQFKAGGATKRSVCGKLIDLTYQRLKSITVTASDYDTLMVIQAARRLYSPPDVKLDIVQSVDLTRQFALGYDKFKDHPTIKEFAEKVKQYNKKLATFGIKDHQVPHIAIGGALALKTLIYRLVRLSLILLISLPGVVLHAPIAYLVSEISEKKAREAKKESKVKIEGKDVIGSWKVLVGLALLPLFYVVYTACFYLVIARMYPHRYAFLDSIIFLLYALPISGYISMKAYEVAGDIVRSLPPLFVSIFYGRQSAQPLRIMRIDLQGMIHSIIDEFGHQFHGVTKEHFDKQRLVRKDGSLNSPTKPVESPVQRKRAASSSYFFGDSLFDWECLESTEEMDDIACVLNSDKKQD